MRCPECRRFVGFGDMDVSEVEVEVDEDDGTVTMRGRISLPCAECSATLKELEVEQEECVGEQFPDLLAVVQGGVPESARHLITEEWVEKHVRVQFELDGEASIEGTERTQTYKEVTFKRGPKKGQTVRKPIPARYAKTYRGVEAEGELIRTVHWPEVDEEGTVDRTVQVEHKDRIEFKVEVEESTASFDEVC